MRKTWKVLRRSHFATTGISKIPFISLRIAIPISQGYTRSPKYPLRNSLWSRSMSLKEWPMPRSCSKWYRVCQPMMNLLLQSRTLLLTRRPLRWSSFSVLSSFSSWLGLLWRSGALLPPNLRRRSLRKPNRRKRRIKMSLLKRRKLNCHFLSFRGFKGH